MNNVKDTVFDLTAFNEVTFKNGSKTTNMEMSESDFTANPSPSTTREEFLEIVSIFEKLKKWKSNTPKRENSTLSN